MSLKIWELNGRKEMFSFWVLLHSANQILYSGSTIWLWLWRRNSIILSPTILFCSCASKLLSVLLNNFNQSLHWKYYTIVVVEEKSHQVTLSSIDPRTTSCVIGVALSACVQDILDHPVCHWCLHINHHRAHSAESKKVLTKLQFWVFLSNRQMLHVPWKCVQKSSRQRDGVISFW